MAAEVLLIKAVDYTLKLLKIREDRNEREKQLMNSVLEAFREAILATRAYIADQRDGVLKRDRDKELELSKSWNTVGVRIKSLETEQADELYEVCFAKADYWSDPSRWDEGGSKQIDISLSRVDKDISDLLGI